MNSVLTETTENTEADQLASGWIFYDRNCRSCSDLALRFAGLFARRGFVFEPLQEHWAQAKLGLTATEALEEMRVLTNDGLAFAGADAIIFLAQQVWWMAPLSWLSRWPGARRLLRSAYAWVAAHRSCTVTSQPARPQLTPTAWLPVILLPLVALITRPVLPPWAFMWTMAGAIFVGTKWLTLSLARTRSPDACPFRSAAYLLAWPGMAAARFLSWKLPPPVEPRAMLTGLASATARLLLGAALLFLVARHAPLPLVTGWIGMMGLVLILHFGLFDLVSLAWRAARVDAPPIMNAPLRSASVGEFWGRRWNGAFNQLALRFVFQPVARRAGAAAGTLCAFGISGLVHELVISLPANGGYGLPTAYFLLQGMALLGEHTHAGKRIGLGHGLRGWLFTILIVAAPAFWLFHPLFVSA